MKLNKYTNQWESNIIDRVKILIKNYLPIYSQYRKRKLNRILRELGCSYVSKNTAFWYVGLKRKD